MNQGPADPQQNPQNQSGLGAAAEEVRQESEGIQNKEGAVAGPEVAERRPEKMNDSNIAEGEKCTAQSGREPCFAPLPPREGGNKSCLMQRSHPGEDEEDWSRIYKEEIDDLLQRLTLEGKRDTLTRADFLEIIPSILQNKEEHKEEKDLVPAFMQRLLTVDYRARQIFVNENPTAQKSHTAGKGAFGALFKKSTEHKEKKQVRIHPMNIQMAVFLRADLFLRQTMVTKLSQCQYAVPLLVPNPLSHNLEFPLWTLREISKSWKTTDTSGKVISKSLPMWKAETPMVAFFRISSISSSKSQLINRLINERHDTFFHRESPGSTKKCLLMDGVVEIAWYLPSGRSTDHLSDCVAFCNLHGDSSTNEPQRKILTERASVNVVLLPKLDEINNNMVIVQNLCEDSKPLIVVITDEEDDEDVVCEIGDRKYRVTLKGRNPSDVSAALREVIKNCLSQNPVTFRFEEMTDHPELKVDEGSEDCKRGKEAAQQIKRFLESEDPSTVKGKYLPCHGKLWHDWCQKNKSLRQLQGNNLEKEKNRIEQEMGEIRKKQKEHGFSELMELFVGNLNSLSGCEKMYFLKWTEILLNEFTSDKLCTIHQQYYKKWAEVLILKKTHDKESKDLSSKQTMTEELKTEQSNLEKISDQLNEATFGLEHMLREVGQIYEASVSEKRGKRRKEDLSYLPDLAAEFMISGHPVELMDGDAAHVPLIWVSAVLDEVIKKLGDPRVFVLSVLGIQSSGKSTMLNAMFGLQFAVSAGRCTRGAFMQLVKVSEEMKEWMKEQMKEGVKEEMKKEMKEQMKEVLKFDYILVVDTEGLRALEMAGKVTIHHDNELATFVVGLGNMTLINIFGENPSEMQDILQIVVQAVMRMKQVRLNPSCMFVHQNVTDVAASDKIMEGRRRLQEKLDEMTRLAAKEEVCDAECFSDVIAFDVQKDVKYFAQLWEGSPPMAPPNPSYSENVQELKRDIVSRASKTDSMKLSQFKQRVEDLWNALLNENFVFSFRNSLEISVYRKLEEEYEKWTWSLRSTMLSVEQKMFNRIASGKVETVEKQELMKEMFDNLKDVQKDFIVYFEKNSEKETLIQWKNRFEMKIQNLHDELIDEAKRKLDDNIQQKHIQKNLDDQRMNYEKALFEKSKELALKLKEERNEERDPRPEFDSMWRNWVSELTKDVVEVLGEFYEFGLVRQQKESAEYRKICNTGDYQNYVSMKRKKIWGKIPLWMKSLTKEDQRSIQELIYEVDQKTREKVNSVSVQGYNKSSIQEIARDVKQTVQNFKSDHDSFHFKTEFFVDLSLYVFEQKETCSEFALKLKEKCNKERNPEIQFDSMWKMWVSELTKDAPKLKDAKISDDVVEVLGQFYEFGRVLQQKESAEYRKICNTGDYQNYVSVKQKRIIGLMWQKSLKPEDQRSIRELISKVIQKTREKVNSFPVSVQGYNKSYIQEIARDVKHTVQDFKPDGDLFQFKPEFSVDLSLYVFEEAEKRLAELHRKYREENDPLFYFEKKRPEYFKVFENYWQGAESAVVLGDLICGKLKETVEQSVYNMIAPFICGEMRGKPPFTGNRSDLEKHILKSLAEQEGDQKQRFNNFLSYLHEPKFYFKSFIEDKVKEFMAAENPRAVSAIREHIEHKQRKIISAAETARDEVRRTNGDVNMWLDIFSNSLIDELGDTRVHLSDDVSQDITDCDVLVEFMRKEFPAVAEELKGSFRKLSDLERPGKILFKHFCRCCWEQCPFCGAVCTNSQGDHAEDHNADFHRPAGVAGRHYRGTTEFAPEFCTTKVASDKSFYPRSDSENPVPYKLYRTAGGEFAKWLISTDFSTLAYWKWFVCEFQQNLEELYGRTFSGQGEIPAEWKQFNLSDAIGSLGLK